MPDADPLTREEREELVMRRAEYAGMWSLRAVPRYEATVRAAEARIEALRAALEGEIGELELPDRSHQYDEQGIHMSRHDCRACRALARLRKALKADESQASGDYSVTRTPESGGAE